MNSYHSFAKAVEDIWSEFSSLDTRMNGLTESVEDGDARVVALEAEVTSLHDSTSDLPSRMAKVIKAGTTRIFADISKLSQQVSELEMGSPFSSVPRDPEDPFTPYFASYHQHARNENTTGRNLREYERLTRNGWILTNVFDSEEEMKEWFRSVNAGLCPPIASIGVTQAVPPPQVSSVDITAEVEALINTRLSEIRASLQEVRNACLVKGVKVGSNSFDSEEEVYNMLVSDNVDPDALGYVVDASSIFAHYKDGSVDDAASSTLVKTMQTAGITDAVSYRYMTSFRESQPRYWLNSMNLAVKEGDRYPILANRVAWEGKSMVKGGRVLLEKALSDAVSSNKAYNKQRLPAGSRTLEVANDSVDETYVWWTNAVSHINHEIQTVSQYGIPEKETFTLVSNELTVIFRCMWDVRMLMDEFSLNRDKLRFAARAIWVTLEAHQIMKEFSNPGFGTHVLISSIFTRFLAEETGANFSSGLASTIQEIRDLITNLETAQGVKMKHLTSRLDALTDVVKKLCTKADVKYTGPKNN
jgi:hypothetical protein